MRQLFQANNKGNIKITYHWPFISETTGQHQLKIAIFAIVCHVFYILGQMVSIPWCHTDATCYPSWKACTSQITWLGWKMFCMINSCWDRSLVTVDPSQYKRHLTMYTDSHYKVLTLYLNSSWKYFCGEMTSLHWNISPMLHTECYRKRPCAKKFRF